MWLQPGEATLPNMDKFILYVTNSYHYNQNKTKYNKTEFIFSDYTHWKLINLQALIALANASYRRLQGPLYAQPETYI